jgi:dUTPase
MTVGELKLLMANLDDNATVLTSGAEVAQAVVLDAPALILEMDPEYVHPGAVVWREAGEQRH